MDKFESKKLFWTIVNEITGAADTTIKDVHGNLVGIGMLLSDDSFVIFNTGSGDISIFDKDSNELLRIDENSNLLLIIKELFESVVDM